MLKVLLTVVILCAATSEGYKILLVSPLAFRSHHNLGSTLAKGLADAGHDVTIITPFQDNYKPKNGSYREIILTGFVEQQEETMKRRDIFRRDTPSLSEQIGMMLTMGRDIVESFFEHTNVQNLLNSDETFHATIMEQFVIDALKGLPKHFNAHQILLSGVGSYALVNHLVGNPSLPSYTPDLLSAFPAKMNFDQRISNTFVAAATKLYLHLYFYPSQNALLQKYLPNSDIYESMYNVSLVLINSHPSLIHAQNKVPNMIDIGGFHLQFPKKLPEDLQEYLDNSINGVVYFSIGSAAKSKDIPFKTRNLILKALGNLKNDVLWKWEEDNLPGQPKNVRIGKWLPQESILAHPNVKLFITHGGYSSTVETIYYGKPVVAIPIFADQKSNAKSLERSGLGKYIFFNDLEETRLTELINEVLSTPKYAEAAKQKSALMRDQQVQPLKTAIYWVEYVIRHNGARHLRVAALDLAWYQYYLLDVIGFLVLVVLSSLFILKKVFSWLCCSNRKISSGKIKRS